MKIKKIRAEDIIKLSSSISLILIEKFEFDDLNTIKNLLSAINCNLACYCTQYLINKK